MLIALAVGSQAMAMSSVKRKLIGTSQLSIPSKMPRTSSAPSASCSTPQTSPNRIKVYVRVRPFNSSEIERTDQIAVNVVDSRTLQFDPEVQEEEFFFRGKIQKRRDLNKKVKKNLFFNFDGVFGPDCSNDEIFEATTQNILSAVFDGYNCSVFAYGATGAGKTFTMLGNEENPGIAYRTIVQLLDQVEEMKETHKVTLGASYIEVYNEIVRDLLHASNSSTGLHIREEGGIVVLSGLKVEPILDCRKLLDLLEAGNRLRTQHPTDRNAESSRSHAIFQVHLKMQERNELGQCSVNGPVKIAKLSMIDLAGSERGSATGFTGIRFKEGSNINKSLLALGNCINALADGQTHIPYRDSKLTRILKDSLGGNCRTLMIANVSPAMLSYDDTYNTLKYASRARTISTKISRNVMCDKLSSFQYQRMVEDLQNKLVDLQKQLITKDTVSPVLDQWTKDVERVMSERKRLHTAHITLQAQCKLTQWRLRNKTFVFSHMPEDADGITRLASAVSQLNARVASFKQRLQETIPLIENNNKERDALLAKLANFGDKSLYEMVYSYWESQVRDAVKEVNSYYHIQLIRLMQKSLDSDKSTLTVASPFLQECFSLLQCYEGVTNDMVEKYQGFINRLKGDKNVTWDEGQESESECEYNEESDDLDYFLRLHPPLDPKVFEDTNKLVKESEDIFLSRVAPLLERKARSAAPLRTIQTPPRVNTRQATMRAVGFGINKENFVSKGAKRSISLTDIRDDKMNNTFTISSGKKMVKTEGLKENRSLPYKVPTPFVRRKIN